MTDQELFEKVKREGEEWMDFYWLVTVPEDEWKRFGWLWERAQEKEWWEMFVVQRIYAPGSILDLNDYDGIIPVADIHPTLFTEALKQYLSVV